MKRPYMLIAYGLFVLAAVTAGLYYQKSLSAHAITPPSTLGELSYQKYDVHQLTSQADIAVNVANGNLILDTNDISLSGAGPKLSLERYFNDLGTGVGSNGSHGTFGIGSDVKIVANSNGSATYDGATGVVATYPSNGSGGYNTTATYPGTKLAAVSGGGWTLTFNQTGEFYTFNSTGQLTKDTDINGLYIQYTYNTDGTLNTATDAQGKVLYFTNYTGTKVGKVSDNTGRYVTYTYDGDNLTRSVDSMGNTWQYQYYDTRGNINQITDPRGYTTTIAYDSSNRVTSIKFDDYTSPSTATTWTYSYDNTNAVTTVTDPNSHATKYTYDSTGRITSTLNAVNNTYGTTWDANNNLTASVDPSTYSTTMNYDSLNNMTAVHNPALANGNPGATTTTAYANSSHPYLPSSSTDAQGNITSYSYTTSGNLSSSSTAGSSGAVATTYKRQGDPITGGGTVNCSALTGEVCTSIDGNGNSTTYTYDSHGNVLTVTPPGPVGVTTYTYDSLSRVHTSKIGTNSMITYTYDNMDRVTQALYASDSSTITYSFDADGNMTQRTGAAGQTIYTYDGYNRVTKLAQQGKADINYTYDSVGNLLTEQSTGGTTTYTYDAANEVTNVNQPNGSANYGIAYTNGRPTTISIPGGITQTIGYDRAGRETSISAVKSGTILTNYSATYTNGSGNDTELMQSETNGVAGTTTLYGYDNLDRIVSASGSGTGSHSYTYSYDSNGNRTQYSKDGTYSAIFGYNTANELTTAGGATYGSYDNVGNQTSNGAGTSFNYNVKNQTSSITLAGGSTSSATYLDADQTGRTSFGSVSYINGLLGLYSESAGSVNTYYTHLTGGTSQTVGETIGTTNYYYLQDLHGSTVALTNGSGTVLNTYTYDPYGQILTTTGTVANSIKYSNGYQDNSTGLYKFGARYYNTVEGRWTQTDPSGQNPGYVYAGSDPINQQDPTGLATGGLGISGCYIFICGQGGFNVGKGSFHPYVGLGLGFGIGVNVGTSVVSSSNESGFSDVGECSAGPVGGSYSLSASGETGGGGSGYFFPAKLSCDVSAVYAF